MTNPRAILWFYPPLHGVLLETDRRYSYCPLHDRYGQLTRCRAIGRYTLSVKDPRTKHARAYAELYQQYAFADRLLLYQRQADPSPYYNFTDPLYRAWLSRITQMRTGTYYRAFQLDFSTDTPFPVRVPTYRLAYESSTTAFCARWSRPPEINTIQPEHPRPITIQSASIGVFSALNDHVRLAPRWWRILRIDVPRDERYPEPQPYGGCEQERLLFGYYFYKLKLRRG